MKSVSVANGLALLNAVLLAALVATHIQSLSAAQDLPVLRGRALEIVDNQGKVRASIKIHGPETVNGRQYPGAVVLVMGDPQLAPAVKLAASDSGGGLGLQTTRNLPDGRPVGVQLHANDARVVLINNKGRERIFIP
jgi:hypothetical protein